MKILIATDGSEYSKAAIEKCCEMFGGTNDKFIRIVSVYENVFPVAGEPFAISADYYQQLEDESKAQAERFAADAAEIIKNKCGGVIAETEVTNGSPERAIIESAQEWGADLIIVGSHGRGFWGRMMIGSVSDAVMHHAPCSVLIVRS
jgi:nucleotide-binding universal stress UspA family protein